MKNGPTTRARDRRKPADRVLLLVLRADRRTLLLVDVLVVGRAGNRLTSHKLRRIDHHRNAIIHTYTSTTAVEVSVVRFIYDLYLFILRV